MLIPRLYLSPDVFSIGAEGALINTWPTLSICKLKARFSLNIQGPRELKKD